MKLDISAGGISVRGWMMNEVGHEMFWIIPSFSIRMYDQIDKMAVGYICRNNKKPACTTL